MFIGLFNWFIDASLFSTIIYDLKMKVKIKYINDFGLGVFKHEHYKAFVPHVLAGEEVVVSEPKKQRGGFFSKLTSLVEVSEMRQSPPCPYYMSCGGCNLQHMNDTVYKDFKTQLIKKALKELKQDEVILSDAFFTTYYKRRRTTFRAYIDQGKLFFGYFITKTKQLLAIDECLLLDKEINSLITPLKELVQGFSAKILVKDNPLEVHVTSCKNGIDLIFKSNYGLKNHEKSVIQDTLLPVIRVSWCCHDKLTVIKESEVPLIELNGQSTPLPPLSFLQVSQDSQNAIIKFILSKSMGKKRILDLFAGIGTYSIPLAQYSSVYAIEGSAESLSSLKSFDGIQVECRDLYKKPVDKLFINGFDMVIINPPRNGATPQIKQIAQSRIKDAVLAYCDLTSFKRDSKIMLSEGWLFSDVSAIDQFYQSPHMEVVAHFKRA